MSLEYANYVVWLSDFEMLIMCFSAYRYRDFLTQIRGCGDSACEYCSLSAHAYLNRQLTIMRVVDNPNCNHCQGAYETAAHFLGECDRYASLRREIWRKSY